MSKESQEEVLEACEEAEAVIWKQKAVHYRNAWEAEKLITKAVTAGQDELLRQLKQTQTGAAFRGLLTGIFTGLILGLIIGAIIR